MSYFAYLQPDPELVDAYVAMVRTADIYVAKGLMREAAQARAAYERMVRDYEQLSVRGSTKADEFIRSRIRTTAVRPPTGGLLERAIHSTPMQLSFPGGGVNIASLDALDKGAVNPRTGGVYWRSQEYGLPVIPGQRPAPGYFMPGYSAPNAGQFRNHPYFQQMGYARGMPALVRKRPLRARHFLRDGADEFAAWHALESARINRRAITSLP